MSKIIIYGGQGYIGRHIVERLHKRHMIYNISPSRFKKNKDLKYQHISGQLWNNFSKIKEISPDYFIIVFFGNSGLNRVDLYSKIRQSIIKIDSSLKKPVNFIFLSTQLVYGCGSVALKSERSFLNPVSIYATECKKMERTLKREVKNKHVIIRVPILYGDLGDDKKGNKFRYKNVIFKFLETAKEKKPIHIYGSGKQYRTILHISDLVVLIDKIIRKNINNLTINASLGEYYSIIQIAKIITNKFGVDVINNLKWPDEKLKMESCHIKMDPRKAREIIRDSDNSFKRYLSKL